jgi:hypothetical protein
MANDDLSEELRFFSGEDQEPFTEELERELIEKGWKAADIATLREQGAMYNRRRHSAVFPFEYDLPAGLGSSDPEPRIPRNGPCPCGSGKKYKKCHGATRPPG